MSAVKKPFATPCTECTFALVNVGLVFILCQYVDLTLVLQLSIDKNKMIFPCLELSSLLSKFSRKQKKSTLYHRSITSSDWEWICQNELAGVCNLRRLLIYDSFSDVGESQVWFASKNLTPCRMHWNVFLIAQIIAKCPSFPNMYGML